MTQKNVDDYSMADEATRRCPLKYYAAMRHEDPVHLDPGTGFYWVSKHDDVQAHAMDWQALSSSSELVVRRQFRPKANALWEAAGMKVYDTLVTGDPPDHEHYRAVGMSLFPPTKAAALTPRIEARVEELLDALHRRAEFDYVAEFATQLPATIVCDEFGLPREDQQRFKQWTDAVFALMVPGISEDVEVEMVKHLIELFRYLEGHILQAQREPSGRVISTLANTPRKDGTPFTTLERSWMAVATFIGGNDTTIGMLTGGIVRLAQDPSMQNQLRENPSLIPNFVEELLRLDGSVQSLMRRTTRDVEISGKIVPKDSDVLLCTASANRDESRWTDPDAFRLDRQDSRRHLAFGQGIHTCIGMHLARKELQIAFRILLERWSRIELTGPEVDELRMPLPFHRAFSSLPVRVQWA